MKKTFQARLALTAIATLLAHGAAQAETANSNFQVGVDVVATCSISAADMTFSQITTGTTSANDAQSELTVNCSDGAPYSVALSNGDNYSGGRRLSNGATFINYELYKDNSRSALWSTASALSAMGTGSNQTHTVYGRILAGQSVPNMGSYADTIVATVTY
jgi:spore coat protein U-like protein